MKQLSRKDLFTIYLNNILCLLFIAVFYSALGSKELNNTLTETALVNRLIKSPDITNIKALIFGFIFPYLRFCLFYAPYLIILVLAFWKKRPDILTQTGILAIILTVGGCFAGAMALGIIDNGQFLYNLLPLFNMMLVMGFVYFLSSPALSNRLKTLTLVFIGLAGIYHLNIDRDNTKIAIEPYNLIPPATRVANLKLVEEAAQGKPIIGMFRESPDKTHDYPFLFSYYRNYHFYLQLLDQYADAVNVDIEPFLNHPETMNSVDRYLFPQNEFNIFLRKEKISYSPEALQQFSSFMEAQFMGDGDRLYVLKNAKIPENLPFALQPLRGD